MISKFSMKLISQEKHTAPFLATLTILKTLLECSFLHKTFPKKIMSLPLWFRFTSLTDHLSFSLASLVFHFLQLSIQTLKCKRQLQYLASPPPPFIFISWRLVTLQYCSGFCHTLTWISHGFTCVPHPDPPSRLPLHPIPLGLPSAPGPSTCLMHPTWAGDLFHPR